MKVVACWFACCGVPGSETSAPPVVPTRRRTAIESSRLPMSSLTRSQDSNLLPSLHISCRCTVCEGVAGCALTSSPAKHRWVSFRSSARAVRTSSRRPCASRLDPITMGAARTQIPPRHRVRLAVATPTTLRSCQSASPLTPAGIGATASPRDWMKGVVEGTGEAVRFAGTASLRWRLGCGNVGVHGI